MKCLLILSIFAEKKTVPKLTWVLLQSIEVINNLVRNQSVGLRPVISSPLTSGGAFGRGRGRANMTGSSFGPHKWRLSVDLRDKALERVAGKNSRNVNLHPGKLTWNLKITCLKREIILQTSILGFHDNFQGCKHICFLKHDFTKCVFFAKRSIV